MCPCRTPPRGELASGDSLRQTSNRKSTSLPDLEHYLLIYGKLAMRSAVWLRIVAPPAWQDVAEMLRALQFATRIGKKNANVYWRIRMPVLPSPALDLPSRIPAC